VSGRVALSRKPDVPGRIGYPDAVQFTVCATPAEPCIQSQAMIVVPVFSDNPEVIRDWFYGETLLWPLPR